MIINCISGDVEVDKSYFNINFFNIDVKFGLSFNIVEIPVILHLSGIVYGSNINKISYMEFNRKSSILLNSTIVCNSLIKKI